MFLPGEKINLTCSCQCPVTRIYFYRCQSTIDDINLKDGKRENAFDFIAEREQKGNYTCQCLTNTERWTYSKPSDPVQISIRDIVAVPRISMHPTPGVFSVGKRVLITCKGDIRCTGETFHLYRNNERLLSRDVSDAARNVTFPIDIQGTQSAGNYSCRYQTEVLLNMKHSPFSEDAMISVRVMKGQYLTAALIQLGLSILLFIVMLIIVVEHFVNGIPPGGMKPLEHSASPVLRNRQSRTINSLD
ncbi:uncharacterized protein [Heterodontus francisci]|uniref:uncharacterized protein n=1 Tax=Heterodontus francisci TaxID=7792 RepID=UPI00355C4E79